MIIIAESKHEHYLIKKFLKESSREDQYVGVYDAISPLSDPNLETAVDTPQFKDTEIHTASRPAKKEEIKKLISAEPKYGSFIKNLASKGMTLTLLAASFLWAASQMNKEKDNNVLQNTNKPAVSATVNVDREVNRLERQAVEQIASDNNVEEEEKPDIYDILKFSKDDLDIKKASKNRRYAGKGIDRSDINSLYNFESSTWNEKVSKPYQDRGGLSIGFGTQLFMDSSDANTTPWQKVFFEDKLGNKPTGNPKTVMRDGIIVNISDIENITENEARKAADKDLEERTELVKKTYPWLENLPRDAQLGYVDMTYNMGVYFKMTGFKKNMKKAADFLQKVQNMKKDDDFYKDVDKEDANNYLAQSINYLESAKKELKYYKTPEQIDYEDSGEELKYSAYYTMSSKAKSIVNAEGHRRALNTLRRIDDAIEFIQNMINRLNESRKTNTLKLVYENLFI
jgi:hypothetical protein